MLSCGCDDPAEVWIESWHKARKAHICEECGHAIQPGENYWRVFIVFDGLASSASRCEPCADLADAFKGLGYCDYMGGLFEAYQEWLEMEMPCPPDDDEEWLSPADRASGIALKHRNRGIENEI